jgi:type III secretion system YscQ/HrcQ family protein
VIDAAMTESTTSESAVDLTADSTTEPVTAPETEQVNAVFAPQQRAEMGAVMDVVTPLDLNELTDTSVAASAGTAAAAAIEPRDLGLLADVEVSLSIELGSISLPLRRLLDLQPGSVLELGRPVDAPVDVLVNGRLLARGDVIMVDGEMSVRISEIVSDPSR